LRLVGQSICICHLPLAWYSFCHSVLVALVYDQADGSRVFFFIRLLFLFLGRNISISSPGDLPEVVLASLVPSILVRSSAKMHLVR
jgi:hypothetical protein